MIRGEIFSDHKDLPFKEGPKKGILSEQGSDTVSATPVRIPYVYLSHFTIRRCSIVSDTLCYSPHFSAPDFSYLVDTSDPLGLSFGLR